MTTCPVILAHISVNANILNLIKVVFLERCAQTCEHAQIYNAERRRGGAMRARVRGRGREQSSDSVR